MRTHFSSYLKATTFLNILSIRSIGPSDFPLREDNGALDELAQSIKSKGLLEPILVRPKGSMFEIVCGHRRYQACKMLRLSEIPAIVLDINDREAFEVSLEENLHRKTLDPFEEARAFKFYVQKYGRGSVTELARKIGKSEEFVSHRIILLQLPEAIQDQIRRRLLNPSDAWEIVRVKDPVKQRELAEAAVENKMSVRELRRAANMAIREIALQGQKAEKDLEDPIQNSFRLERSEARRLKFRKAASSILRVALVRVDDLVDSIEDGEEDLRSELIDVRLKIHDLIDEFFSAKMNSRTVREELSAFIRQVFLTNFNSGNTSASFRFKSKSFTVFDDLGPNSLMDLKQQTTHLKHLSKALRGCNCDIENLRITPFGGGAIATFVFLYYLQVDELRGEWKSRVTLVFERTNGTWTILHEHWSPCDFHHETIDSLKKELARKKVSVSPSRDTLLRN